MSIIRAAAFDKGIGLPAEAAFGYFFGKLGSSQELNHHLWKLSESSLQM